MAWVKFGLGGFGLVLIGVAGLMTLGEAGVAMSPMGMSLMALLLAILTLVKLAPDRMRDVVQSLPGLSTLRNRLNMSPAEAVDDAFDADNSAPGPVTAAAVSLMPMMPSASDKQTNSWIGGAPVLPQGAEWPAIDGKPAQFLAQIDCGNLPAELWGGAGPRTGQLVFFRAAQTAAGSCPVEVLHVQEPLAMPKPPKGAALRPRWPLRVAALNNGVEEFGAPMGAPETETDPDWVSLHDVDLSNPAYRPFDWPSAEILLNCMKSLVQGCAERLGDGAASEDRDCLKTTALQLADLIEAFWSAKPEMAFSQDICQMLMDGLAGLTLPDCVAREDVVHRELLPLAQHRGLAGLYFAPFERYCRVVFAADPQSLPGEQRALFEPLWMHNARHETGCMGAQGRERFAGSDAADAVLLMELPSSELLGWTFGDARAFRVFIMPDALARGDLSSVWANVVA